MKFVNVYDRKIIQRMIIALGCLMNVLRPPALKSEALVTETLISQADLLQLDQNQEWQRILFYVPKTWGQPVGIIDDPTFYLTADGKYDPRAELHATLKAFFTSYQGQDPNEHPICHYPARFEWLKNHLTSAAVTWPLIACPKYDSWSKDRNYDAMSVVFSSFYPDNPASMFGHIFLRLHRSRNHMHQSDLLDDIINFAAYPDTSNPILYNIKGASGGFPGRFSLLPYYMKIQEYTNIESRDLWEYKLNIQPTEIHKILLSLWEFGPHYADYYYFDDNCSYVLLVLMQTGNSHWDFTSKLRYWATPTSSLNAVLQSDIGIRERHFRASALSRYRERFDALDSQDAAALTQIIQESNHSLTPLKPLSWQNQKQVIDAALEYIDYREKLGGNHQAKTYASLRQELLSSRSVLPLGAAAFTKIPDPQDPQLAHSESWLMLSSAKIASEQRLRLSWQPVLHDLLGDVQGYADGMQIQIMPMDISVGSEHRAPIIERFDVLNIVSLHPFHRLLQPGSWSFRLGWTRENLCGKETDLCTNSALASARGFAWQLPTIGALRLTAAGMIKLQLGVIDESLSQAYGQAGPELRLLGEVLHGLRFQATSHAGYRGYRGFRKTRAFVIEQELALATTVWNKTELRASFNDKRFKDETQTTQVRRDLAAGVLRYF